MSPGSKRDLRVGVLAALALLPPLAVGVALVVGASPAGWRELVDVLAGRAEAGVRQIVLGVRLPRALLAGLVGGALSGAGVAFQAILRNPLADPFILGVSGGAAVGAVLFTTLLGPAVLGSSGGRALAAFAGALATLFVLFNLSRVRGRTGTTTLLLIGVVLNAFYSAIILFLITAGDPSRFQGVLYFLVGQIKPPAGSILGITATLVLLGVVLLVLQSHRLNLLAFGEETAGQLGVDVERTLWIVVVGASLVTAAAVATAGLVGFVGLIVPHIARTLLGPDHRLLVPAAVLTGAAFLVAADSVARTVVAPVELPVGVITTLLGGPFFLVLFLQRLRAEGEA